MNEVGQLFIPRAQLGRGQREQLTPVGAGLEWGEFLFDDRKEAPDRGPVLFPGEVDGYAWLPVARTHPQVIGRDGADLRDQQVWSPLVAQTLQRQNCVDGVAPGHEVFRLELFPGA